MDYERWKRLMEAFGLDHNKDTWEVLIHAYSEKHRFYHSTEHINATLKQFDKVAILTKRAEEIELALWFHDAVYMPVSTTNELDSANWAAEFLSENKKSNEIISRIHQLIMATCHSVPSHSLDESLIVDIDLTILGTPQNIYEKFELEIRKEYELIPLPIYKKKRKSILNHFLAKDRIYQNRCFYEKLENQARLNLGNAILSL